MATQQPWEQLACEINPSKCNELGFDSYVPKVRRILSPIVSQEVQKKRSFESFARRQLSAAVRSYQNDAAETKEKL